MQAMPHTIGPGGEVVPFEMTTEEKAALTALDSPDKAAVIRDRPDADSIWRPISQDNKPIPTLTLLNGLVHQEGVVIYDALPAPHRHVVSASYPDSAYLNRFLEAADRTPGEDSFRFVDCDVVDDFGFIPGVHFLEHVARREAPRTTHPALADHDRRLSDHPFGWASLYGQPVEDAAGAAGTRLEEYEADPSVKTRRRANNLAHAVDLIASITTYGQEDIRKILEGRRVRHFPLLIPAADIEAARPFAHEVYFDGDRRARKGKITATAARLHKGRKQVARELVDMSEDIGDKDI